MNDMTVARRLVLAFASLILIFLIVAGITLNSAARQAEAERWSTHTYKVLELSALLVRDMVNMETGTRGFLLSGDEQFLEPWNNGQREFDRHWDEVKQLTADNPSQQQRLMDMQLRSREFRAVAEAAIQLRRSVTGGQKSMDDLLSQFRLGRDKAAMDAFRALQAEFDGAERKLLVVRSQDAEALRSFNRSSIVAGTLLAVVLAAAMGTWVTRSLLRLLGGEPAYAASVAREIAQGRLAVDVRLRAGDTTSLLADMKAMRDSLSRTVGQVRRGAESVFNASIEIAGGNADLSQRTEEQASALQQTAATMDQLSGTVRTNAESAKQADQLAKGAATVATHGGSVVNRVVSTMEGISQSSRKIGEIIGVIDGIAFQTNILALNAAVEAARAGEQGRGFAVVAGEVRNLAQRSAEAAKEIKSLITRNVEQVEEGTGLVDQAGKTMQEIVGSIQRVSDIVSEITSASSEQSNGIQQVGNAVAQMDHVTQQNAALVEQGAAAAESLKAQAQQMVEAVSFFRVNGDGSA